MKRILFAGLVLTSSLAQAATETTTGSFAGFQQRTVAAVSRSEALVTQSTYYALPARDMTYMELGALNQRQTLQTPLTDKTHLNNQAFFFNHSRGLNELLALDFHLDYFLRDEAAVQGSTGVNRIGLGVRSHFDAMDLRWIYGGHASYLPQGELHEEDSKAVISGRIGFEETVDIARWGIEAEGTTKNTAFFDNQVNLQGFFEMPFVRRFDVGVAAGTDLLHLAGGQVNNFARVYGDYLIDSVSTARISLQQKNESADERSLSETEVGLSLNRVF